MNIIKEAKTDNYKVGLPDYTKMHSLIKDWLTDLSLTNCIEAMENEPEELEYLNRDGFIPHTHNHGGFDKWAWTDLMAFHGGGYSAGSEMDERINQCLADALEQFKSDKAEELKDIPEDKINYHDLYDMDRSDLAEELSEYEFSHLGFECSSVGLQVRVMYEGIENGVHTIMIYSMCNWKDAPYHRSRDSQDLGEYEVKFKTLKSLERQLTKLTKTIEQDFRF